ncbi:MAG: hypothetical protein QXX09_02340, partial [Candidatus Methanomethylicia archaeon]
MENINELLNEVEGIRRKLNEEYELREKLHLKIREIQRLCGEAISQIQQGKIDQAKERILIVEDKMEKELIGNLEEINEAYNMMLQEYVEAKALLKIEEEGRIPTLKELKTTERAYILGLVDLMGELKRRIITHLINEEIDQAKIKMEIVKQLFQALEVLEYPRSLIPGL